MFIFNKPLHIGLYLLHKQWELHNFHYESILNKYDQFRWTNCLKHLEMLKSKCLHFLDGDPLGKF